MAKAKIKMSVIGEEDETEAKEEAKGKEAEAREVAEKIAKDVAEKPKPKPKSKKAEENTDDDPNFDPDENYPKIALVRVSVGGDDERSMQEWTEKILDDLGGHKNATVLTKHFLVDGVQVAAHKVTEKETT